TQARAETTDVTLRVVAVRPHERFTVAVSIDGRAVAQRDFEMPGPWPPWVASHNVPAWSDWWTYALFALIAVALASAWYGTDPETARPELRALPPLCLAAGTIVVLSLCFWWPPEAVEAPELGGVVEFALPIHAGTPPALQHVIKRVAAAAYTKL